MRAQEFIVEYRLSVSKDADGVAVKATAGGKNLGHAEFFFDEEGRLDPQTVWVDERYHGQGIARDMYDHLKDLGYTIVRSWDQTDAGRGFWNKHRGEDARVWEQELSEISRDRLERYLSRAGRQVDSRQERMARARQRLNTSYEIYHAEEPTKIVDRFEADTPADAQRYYQDYIERYESDVDYDLRLRQGTGIMESYQRKLNFDEIYGKYLKVTDNNGDPNQPGFSLVTPLNGASWNWHERPEFIPLVKKKLNQPGWLGNHKYQQIIDAMAGREFDPKRHIAEFAPSPGYEPEPEDDVPRWLMQWANLWWNQADPERQQYVADQLASGGWIIRQVDDDTVEINHKEYGLTYRISDDQFDPDVFENFADGKVKGKSRPGRVKRAGASCSGSVTSLRARAKKYGGEKGKMYHWCANMKAGKKKAK